MHKKIAASFLAFLLTAGVATAGAAPTAPSIPKTPAGQALSAWLQAFDSGDKQQLLQFMRTYEPQNIKQIGGEMEFQRFTGGFDLRKIEKSTPMELTALVQERFSDTFARLTLQLQPPHHVTNLDLLKTPRPPEFALPHLAQADLVAQLGQRAQQETAADRFAGAVLVAKDGRPVFEQAYGLADRAHNVANTIDTRFRIGSMNKMFTATAIMQLVQAGKIDLDKPFGTYLTDYPNKDTSSSVTIRQLLTHTGGTGDIFVPEYFKNRLNVRTLQDYINLLGKRALSFKPGSKWEYSNYGFILLGALVARVSGQTYYDYVHDHIYAPAGMNSTGSEPEDVAVPNRSVGYMMSPDGKWLSNRNTLPYRGTSAGGGYSTVGDFLKFANALLSHKLLNAQYTGMMTSAQTQTGQGDTYGFGFGQQTINGTRCFGHSGGAPGMNGDFEICPDSGYVVVVLSNLDPPAASRVSDFITNRLPAP